MPDLLLNFNLKSDPRVMPAAQWTLGVDAIVKAVGEHSTFIKLVNTVQQAQWTKKSKKLD